MSFDYYQKTSTPGGRSTKVTTTVEESPQDTTKRKEGLTKSVKKRKQTIAFDEPDVSFSFSVTRPEHERDESPTRRPAKSASSASSKVNNSTTKKTAGVASTATASSRNNRSTTDTNTSTHIPSKASAEMAAEAHEERVSKNATAGTSMRSSPPTKSSQSTSKSRKKAGNADKDSGSEQDEAGKDVQMDESSPELPPSSAADEDLATHSPSTPPRRRNATTADPVDKEDLDGPNFSPQTPPIRRNDTQHTEQEDEAEHVSHPPASASRASSSGAGKSTSKDQAKETAAAGSKQGPSATSKSGSRSSSSKDAKFSKSAEAEPEEADDKRNPKKRTSRQADSTSPPKKAKLSENTAEPSRSSKSGRDSSKSKSKSAKSESKAVELEDNLVSYWDFVTERRGETLLQKMKRDKRRKITAEEEEMMRIVKNRFYAEAAVKYRPPNDTAPNPINDELEIAVERYQRIIDLLEHENAELEIIGHRARLQLDAEQEGESLSGHAISSTAKSAPSTPGRTSKRGNQSAPNSAKKTTAAQRRASIAPVSTMDVSTPTESSVAQIFKSLPPGETLLADEDKAFLTARPALAGNVNLPLLSRLQTRFDALEMLTRQIGYVNDTFEEKASSTSAAMHAYMVPSGAPKINLAAMLESTAE